MKQSQNSQAYQILSSGRVQGVSYRRFVQASAQSLGLRGWTRNLNDGRVESLVIATPDMLDVFVRALKTGPPRSRVEEIEIFVVQKETGEGFEIRPDAAAPEPRD